MNQYAMKNIGAQEGPKPAGPFLSIEGQNDEPDGDDENMHQFYLCSHAEIDQFAAICHDLLRQAEVE